MAGHSATIVDGQARHVVAQAHGVDQARGLMGRGKGEMLQAREGSFVRLR